MSKKQDLMDVERTIIAYFTVDEERSFNEADGPIDYLVRKAEKLEPSGIVLDDCAIADDDADDPQERFLVYLARVAYEHFGDADFGDEDDNPKERYMVYLARFAHEHIDDADIVPPSYQEWLHQ